MKTNEFIKEVEAMGFDAVLDCRGEEKVIDVRERQYGGFIVNATVNKRFNFYIAPDSFDETLDNEKQQKLFNLLTEYAKTPVEEREEEKKYKYCIKEIEGLNLHMMHLTFVELNSLSGREGYFILDYLDDDRSSYKQVFTHSWLRRHSIDIEQLKEVCEEIEVEE